MESTFQRDLTRVKKPKPSKGIRFFHAVEKVLIWAFRTFVAVKLGM
jgi:hypothetical protein